MPIPPFQGHTNNPIVVALAPPTFIEANGGPNTNGAGSIVFDTAGAAGDILLFQNDQSFAGAETVKRHSDAVSLNNFASGPSYDVSTGSSTINSLWYSILVATETQVDITGGAAATSIVSHAIFRPGAGATFNSPLIHPASPGVAAWADNSATLTIPGFTPGAKTAGAVIVLADQSGSATVTATGFTAAPAATWSSQFGVFKGSMLYNFAYAGGNVTVNFSGTPAPGAPHYGYLIELRYN